MEEFTSVGGSKLLSGKRFRMGLKDDGFAIDISELRSDFRILINTSLEFEYGVLFTFSEEESGNLLIKVERQNSGNTYSPIGYLRKRDELLLVDDDPVANIKLERYESVYYNIICDDEHYDMGCGGLSFCDDPDLKRYSAFYFIDE